jgi:ABC-type sulfate transport system permease subunit
MKLPVFITFMITMYQCEVEKFTKRIALNEHAGVEAWIIGLAVGILVMAYVLPMAFTAFYGASVNSFCKTTILPSGATAINIDTTVVALWYLIPVLIIIGIIIFFATHRHG